VLLNATKSPRKIEASLECPSQRNTRATITEVMESCKPPPKITILRSCKRSRSENSIPIVKSRSTTPISAKNSMFSISLINPKPKGPARIPASRKPMSGAIFNFEKVNTTGIESPKMIRRSVKRFVAININ